MTSVQAETETSRAGQAQAALLRSLRPWLTLILVCALFSLHSRFRATFWTADYLPNVVQQSSRNIVLAVGMSFVVLTGGIDLSVGSILALCGVALGMGLTGTLPGWLGAIGGLPIAVGAASLIRSRLRFDSARTGQIVALAVFGLVELFTGFGLARAGATGVKVEGAIALALLIGMGCGIVNGVVVSVGRVPSFVATLGMLSVARGLTLYATDGNSVPAAIPRFMRLGQSWPLALVTLAVVVVGTVLLARSKWGRYILSVGGNESASHLSGVPVPNVKTLAFVLSGLAAAIGAVLVTAKFGSADTGAGTGAELDAIAAVVIGGTSLSGGQGSIVGALVGALTITIIEAGLVLVGIKDTLQPVILGGVIVLTVFVDQVRRGK